ncbi:MAG: hypothetical protein ABL901_20455 [Hyphomicrobiaceae bacterium]
MTPPVRQPITPVLAATVAVLFASVAGQAVGAAHGSVGMSVFAAMAFAGALLRVGWMANKPWWQCETSSCMGPPLADAHPITASRNAELLALGYAWGGLTLLAVYLLTPLRWQHGWQYGSGMLLIAVLIYALSRGFAARWSRMLSRTLSWLTLLHGWAATAGLAWLIGSGKIWSVKGDWAADIVFAVGALVITGISALALRTSRILTAHIR